MLYPPIGATPAAPPDARVLVHNHVRPAARLGTRGFRFWYQVGEYPPLLLCACGWAPEIADHYRLTREGADLVERATRYAI
jgi:hypothetical protein